MNDINNKYRVLNENNYNITIKDQVGALLVDMNKEDYIEYFDIKSPKAYKIDYAP